MNFTYDFPVINNNPQKTASHKKIRRIGRLRLGDSYRNLRSRFELTPVKIPEDSGTEAYTLPLEREILFHGVPVTAAGVSIKNGKVRAIHADTAASPDEMKRILTDLYGTPEKKERRLFLGRHGDNRLHDRRKSYRLCHHRRYSFSFRYKRRGKCFRRRGTAQLQGTALEKIRRSCRTCIKKNLYKEGLSCGNSRDCHVCFHMGTAGTFYRRRQFLYHRIHGSGYARIRFSYQPCHPPFVGYRPFPPVLLGILRTSLYRKPGRRKNFG